VIKPAYISERKCSVWFLVSVSSHAARIHF